MEPLLLAYLFFGLISGAYASNVADAKGYSAVAWFFGGFFFSLLALIAIAGMPLNPAKPKEKKKDDLGNS